MRYLLLIYGDEGAWSEVSEADQEAQMGRWNAYTEAIRRPRASCAAATPCTRRRPPRRCGCATAQTQVTDGPFAETREQLGGYYMIECDTLDQAIEAARRIPSVDAGSVEVRPIMEFD